MRSTSVGVRIPGELLREIDEFNTAQSFGSRSEAIVTLVRLGLSQKHKELPVQDQLSGATASKWGRETAQMVAKTLGASRLENPQIQSNEFVLDGKNITIRCAKPKTTSVGLTNPMRNRVDYIVGAFQRPEGHFTLLRITPEIWSTHCRESSKNHNNRGRVTLCSRSVFEKYGDDLGEVDCS